MQETILENLCIPSKTMFDLYGPRLTPPCMTACNPTFTGNLPFPKMCCSIAWEVPNARLSNWYSIARIKTPSSLTHEVPHSQRSSDLVQCPQIHRCSKPYTTIVHNCHWQVIQPFLTRGTQECLVSALSAQLSQSLGMRAIDLTWNSTPTSGSQVKYHKQRTCARKESGICAHGK